jgi:hypothetical protein
MGPAGGLSVVVAEPAVKDWVELCDAACAALSPDAAMPLESDKNQSIANHREVTNGNTQDADD